MSSSTKIDVLHTSGCQAAQPTEALVRETADALGLEAEVSTKVIENIDAAKSHRFPGSPTVRVNGIDVEPHEREPLDFGLG